ncbi:MAG: glutathione S-transferase family protein [Solirubrobacterales bacterium]
MSAKLYSISVSHPARAAGLMLQRKGIECEIVNLTPGSQRVLLRLRGFPDGTVPAMTIDGRKVQGSLEISRALEELKPDPPLFPADSEKRAAVEEAERWGDAVLQSVPRNLFRWCLARDGEARRGLAEATKTPAPALVKHVMKPVAWYFARIVSGATDETVRAQLAALPEYLDHVDGLIAEGVIGGEEPNAADFQIATTVRVLLNYSQLRPLIEPRPVGELAMRIVPRFGGELPVKLPPEWIPSPG